MSVPHALLALLREGPKYGLRLGVPLVASAAGWLLAGREPPAIARTAIE